MAAPPRRLVRGRNAGKPKLTDEQRVAIRNEYHSDPRASYAGLAKKYGVNPTTIQKCVNPDERAISPAVKW